jgi:hypothetical protein
MTLTTEQGAILAYADRSGEAPCGADMPKVPGFHFCPDWDYLPICDNSPEIDDCTCAVKWEWG